MTVLPAPQTCHSQRGFRSRLSLEAPLLGHPHLPAVEFSMTPLLGVMENSRLQASTVAVGPLGRDLEQWQASKET